MNIVLDIGNSRIKIALFQQQKLLELKIFDKKDTAKLKDYLSSQPSNTACVISLACSV